MNFHKRLKKYLDDHHVNRSSVAREMGISPNKLNATANGERELKIEEFKKLCIALDEDPDVLINYPLD